MILQAIASGSNGNCFLLQTKNEVILIDNGISFKKADAGLRNLGIIPKDVKYILITHAHWDHIGGLPVFCDRTNARVIATEDTIEEISNLGHKDPRFFRIGKEAIPVQIEDQPIFGDLEITAFNTYHDIAGASGFHINYLPKDFEISYATDTRDISQPFREKMKSSDVIVIESNHDTEMLKNSVRPASLKNRIRKTHLNNNKTIEIINEVVSEYTKIVYLAHLSGECNKPSIVASEIEPARRSSSYEYEWVICPRDKASSIARFENNTLSSNNGKNYSLSEGINSRDYVIPELKKTIDKYF